MTRKRKSRILSDDEYLECLKNGRIKADVSLNDAAICEVNMNEIENPSSSLEFIKAWNSFLGLNDTPGNLGVLPQGDIIVHCPRYGTLPTRLIFFQSF